MKYGNERKENENNLIMSDLITDRNLLIYKQIQYSSVPNISPFGILSSFFFDKGIIIA